MFFENKGYHELSFGSELARGMFAQKAFVVIDGLLQSPRLSGEPSQATERVIATGVFRKSAEKSGIELECLISLGRVGQGSGVRPLCLCIQRVRALFSTGCKRVHSTRQNKANAENQGEMPVQQSVMKACQRSIVERFDYFGAVVQSLLVEEVDSDFESLLSLDEDEEDPLLPPLSSLPPLSLAAVPEPLAASALAEALYPSLR